MDLIIAADDGVCSSVDLVNAAAGLQPSVTVSEATVSQLSTSCSHVYVRRYSKILPCQPLENYFILQVEDIQLLLRIQYSH